MSHDMYCYNIMSCYRRADARDRAFDAGWYADAQALALSLTPDDVWRAAGVLSALSPRKRWPQNVIIARRSLETGIAQGNMPMHNAIAQRVIDGNHPLDVMKGDKTRSFTEAIATGGKGMIATIDCHAHDIAMGRVFPEKERKIGKRVYREMAAAYRECAEYTGESVNAIQAITWVAWRKERGIA